LLGLTDVDVVRVPKDWSADQVKAFALADNRTAELAEWNPEVLSAQLLELGEAGFDVEALGFKLASDDVDIFTEAMPWLFTYSHPHAALYLWYASGKGHYAYNAVRSNGYEVRAQIVWHKLKAHYGAFMSQYMPKHEPSLYCFKSGQSAQWFGPTNEVTVWEYDQPSRNEHHPTEKPVTLFARAIANSSKPGDIVLDAFGGSGTLIMACEQLDRNARVIELDPKYCDVIVKRWESVTGRRRCLRMPAGRPPKPIEQKRLLGESWETCHAG
jgi:hypothetical protein